MTGLDRLRAMPAIAVAAALSLLTLIVFSPTLLLPFVEYDDQFYVSRNVAIADGFSVDAVVWAFTGFAAVNYHPITWLSHLLDVELYGLAPAGHHLTSTLLHAANAGLTLLVVEQLLRRRGLAVIVAVVFAVHPQRVESVAWISERKDVLSGFFFLLMLLSYVRGHRERRSSLRLLAVVWFLLGLLSKPMLVTAPAVLLLVDVAFLDRWDGSARGALRLGLEKLPLIGLSLLEAWATLLAQQEVIERASSAFSHRLASVLIVVSRYVDKSLIPHDLSMMYILHPRDFTAPRLALAAVVVVGISAAAVAVVRRSRAPIAGWLWFVGMLVPVVGFVPVGAQAMADRYTYLPVIGLSIGVVCFLDVLVTKERARRLLIAGFIAFSLVCVAVTERQIPLWSSAVTLFENANDVDPECATVHSFLGRECLVRGDIDCAERHTITALQLNGNDAFLQRQIAMVWVRGNKLDRAEPLLLELIARDPQQPTSWRLLGDVERLRGKSASAVARYRMARALGEEVTYELGRALLQDGQAQAAADELVVVVDGVGEGAAGPAYHLAQARLQLGQVEQAKTLLVGAAKAARENGDAALLAKIEALQKTLPNSAP